VFAGPIGRAVGAPEDTLALQIFPVAVACGVLESLIASVFQGFEDVVPNAVLVLILNPALFLGFLVALWLSPAGVALESSILAYVGANVVTVVALAVYALRRLPARLGTTFGGPEARRRLFALAAPLFLVGVMVSIAGTADTLILGFYHNGEVGTYSASLTLARILQIGIGAAGYIFLPVAAKFLRRDDRESVRLTYATVTKWMVLFSLPLVLLFVVLPSASLGFVYGPGYTSVVLPLQLMSVAAFATALLGPAAPAQIAFGDARLQAYNAVVSAGVDVAVALVLVPPYGYIGAAVAWGSANLTWSALCLGELARLRAVHPFRLSFLLPLLATLVPTAVVLVLVRSMVRWWILPPIAVLVALAFVALVLLSGSVDRGDRLLLDTVEGVLGRPLPWLRRVGRFARRFGRGG
jgi:O-antigen/teichoic acid export membrane protein